jgi:hypothetical protein
MTSYICSEVVHNEIFVFKGQGLKDAHVGDILSTFLYMATYYWKVVWDHEFISCDVAEHDILFWKVKIAKLQPFW